MAFSFLLLVYLTIHLTSSDSYKYVSANSECEPNCDGSESNPYPTIQQGIDNTGNSDVILKILAGTYKGSGNKNFTLSSSYYRITTEYPSDPSRTIIDCENDGFGFELYSGSYSIIGLTIQNCVAPYRALAANKYNNQTLGGALFIQSVGTTPNISNCTLKNNNADIGAGIYIYSASVVLANALIEANKASNLSGGIYIESGYLRYCIYCIVYIYFLLII